MTSTGLLICPNCGVNGMGDYTYWESKPTYNNQDLYIFYNKKKESNKWKCWALLGYCGCTIHNWWDPWGIFVKMCKEENIKNFTKSRNDDKESASTKICMYIVILGIVIFIFEIYFILYFFFCIWFDIYYACCNKDKIRHVCDGYGELIIKEGEDMWRNQEGIKYTEDYWNNNFKRLFKCDSCNYAGQSFKDFIGNDYLNVTVNNDSTTIPNTTQINSQLGEAIKVQFSHKDRIINIQSNIHALFSEVVNSLYVKIPEYKNKECLFFYNNNQMENNKTLQQNGYTGGKIDIYVNE